MKITSQISRVVATGCLLGLALTRLEAAITDEEFNALKDLVTKQGQRLEQLEKAHEKDQQAIEGAAKVHEQDQQELQRLKQQLQETQKTASEAQQKAETASQAQVQPVHPIPEGPAATHNFMVVGDAEVQFGKVEGSHSAFALADFAPIFLFRARDDILFEAGFDVTLQNGATTFTNGLTHDSGATTAVNLSFATLDYLFNDYSTLVAGDMLLPLGTYSERSAGWLNLIPDAPLPRAVLPPNGLGAQLRGGVPIGSSGQSLSYSAYVVNGPSSVDGTANATAPDGSPNLDLHGNVGIGSNGTFGNLHSSPGGGGRIGWFAPLKPHYDLELGFSGQTGPWSDSGGYLWSAAVLDYALHVGPNVEVKGEWINTWEQTSDAGTVTPRGWWIQGAYKLAGLNLEVPVINNVQLVGRYDTIKDGLGGHTDRYTVGGVYYFSNTLLFEGDYEFINSNDPALDRNLFVLQLSYGF
jgi:hypothetical protein